MPRKIRSGGTFSVRGSVATGTAAGTVVVLGPEKVASCALVTPMDNMVLLGAEIVQQIAGVGTGTMGISFAHGASATVISEVTANTFIDYDAAAGVVHGHVAGNSVAIPVGSQIKAVFTAAGTLTTTATLSIDFIFSIGA